MIQATPQNILFVSLELSNSNWLLTMSRGTKKRRRASVDVRKWHGRAAGAMVRCAIEEGKQRLGLSENAKVVSCFEAGRDGFWLDRFLHFNGLENHVMHSSSIEVPQGRKRKKSDRLDGECLVRILMRWHHGDKDCCRMVAVPSVAMEDARRLNREYGRLKKELNGHMNRIGGLLVGIGVRMSFTKKFVRDLEAVRLWNGDALPEDLKEELLREYERYALADKHILLIRHEMKARLAYVAPLKKDSKKKDPSSAKPFHPEKVRAVQKIHQLMQLRGIEWGAWTLGMEFFAWRKFRNRRELGSLAGLTPPPWSSGGMEKDKSITKEGNGRVRSLMTELAWCWIRYQGESKLTKWYRERFDGRGKRAKRVGIVALSRKLLIAFWRFFEHGEVPEGAVLKNA